MTESSLQALDVLRKTNNVQWYIVPLLVLVIYVYVNEIEKKNWSAVLLGISASAGEFIWEMFNACVLHFSGHAPLWGTPGGNSSYVLYVGLNIEIIFFFAMAGVILVKALPAQRNLKILGVPNRIFIPTCLGLLSVGVETLLNRAGLLTWDWVWWGWPHVWLIICAYCGFFLFLAWCHDHFSLRTKAYTAVLLPIAAICCHIVLTDVLGWI